MHEPVTIILGRSVTEKVRNKAMLCFPTSPIYSASALSCERGNPEDNTGALCMEHSPTAAALSISFLLNHAPQQPRAEHIDHKILGSHTAQPD